MIPNQFASSRRIINYQSSHSHLDFLLVSYFASQNPPHQFNLGQQFGQYHPSLYEIARVHQLELSAQLGELTRAALHPRATDFMCRLHELSPVLVLGGMRQNWLPLVQFINEQLNHALEKIRLLGTLQ
jgi:hypothetical protein